MPSRKRLVLGVGLALLALLPPLAILLDEPFLLSLFSRVLIYGLAAASLDLIVGYGGMVSFGHAAYFGAGAYVVAILAFHGYQGEPVVSWPWPLPGTESALVVLPLAMLAGAALAALFGSVCLRTEGIHFIMITLAFAQMLFYLMISMSRYGGEDGLSLWSRSQLPGVDLGSGTTFYYFCLTALLSFLFLGRRLVDSRFGMILRGCKQNQRRLSALGVDTFRYRLAAFALAGAGAGLAGALIANQTEFVSPSLLHWTRSGELLAMVILGGLGTLYGPVFGAAALLLMQDLLSGYSEHWMVPMGVILLTVALFARRGIYGVLAGPEADDG
jgi:branched-chain amino acid transport system permease protein